MEGATGAYILSDLANCERTARADPRVRRNSGAKTLSVRRVSNQPYLQHLELLGWQQLREREPSQIAEHRGWRVDIAVVPRIAMFSTPSPSERA